MTRTARLILLLACMLCLLSLPATAEPISLADVIETVLERHPDMAISRLQPDFSKADAEGLSGQLDPTVSASIGGSEEKLPLISNFAPIGTTAAQLKGNVTKPLAGGGSLSVDIDYNRGFLAFNSPFASQLANPNPSFRNQIDLSYRHPLLRGAGRPSYHKLLEAAQADEQAAITRIRTVQDKLALQALELYYGIASDTTNLTLGNKTVARAKRLLEDQRMRERFGLIEEADRLQAEALLATRKMDRSRVHATLKRNRAALNRLMLQEPGASLSVDTEEAIPAASPNLDAAMQTARDSRPELKELESRLQAAEARILEVQDREQTQLDIVATLGSRGVASNYGSGFVRGGSLNDRFASIELELSDTLGNRAVKAEIRKALLARSQIELEKEQVLELIKDDISRALTAFSTELITYQSAQTRVVAEKRKFEAEMRRYREGRSSTATLIQFEGELLAAEVDMALSRIILLLSHRQLQWSEGILLHELGIATASNDLIKTQK